MGGGDGGRRLPGRHRLGDRDEAGSRRDRARGLRDGRGRDGAPRGRDRRDRRGQRSRGARGRGGRDRRDRRRRDRRATRPRRSASCGRWWTTSTRRAPDERSVQATSSGPGRRPRSCSSRSSSGVSGARDDDVLVGPQHGVDVGVVRVAGRSRDGAHRRPRLRRPRLRMGARRVVRRAHPRVRRLHERAAAALDVGRPQPAAVDLGRGPRRPCGRRSTRPARTSASRS